uniref:Uncharacterized protein n=1 Tax=Arundo donax TaxID=35708 RepID=A0A0A8XYT6_ARUDO
MSCRRARAQRGHRGPTAPPLGGRAPPANRALACTRHPTAASLFLPWAAP